MKNIIVLLLLAAALDGCGLSGPAHYSERCTIDWETRQENLNAAFDRAHHALRRCVGLSAGAGCVEDGLAQLQAEVDAEPGLTCSFVCVDNCEAPK